MPYHGGRGKNDFTFPRPIQPCSGENQSYHETSIDDSFPGDAAGAECGPTTNWLRLLDMVEMAINNAPIANTELSHFYLNLGYHPHSWFDFQNFDEVRLEGDKTIQVKDWIANMRADWDLVYRALYHKHARAETFGNRKLADYQFKVG